MGCDVIGLEFGATDAPPLPAGRRLGTSASSAKSHEVRLHMQEMVPERTGVATVGCSCLSLYAFRSNLGRVKALAKIAKVISDYDRAMGPHGRESDPRSSCSAWCPECSQERVGHFSHGD